LGQALRRIAVFLCVTVVLGLSLSSLYRAWRDGEVFLGVNSTDTPVWFAVYVALGGLASALCVGLLAAAAYGNRLDRRYLQRRFRGPPLDTAVREPLKRE
jgi:hypothetical protein